MSYDIRGRQRLLRLWEVIMFVGVMSTTLLVVLQVHLGARSARPGSRLVWVDLGVTTAVMLRRETRPGPSCNQGAAWQTEVSVLPDGEGWERESRRSHGNTVKWMGFRCLAQEQNLKQRREQQPVNKQRLFIYLSLRVLLLQSTSFN